MKTIKLILNADGSVNSLTYGFQLNQYSYADTLINIYVPTEIVDLNITQLDGATYSTNVIMSVNYLQANGTYKLGNPYYFTYVKTNVIIDNVNYTLFERTMPREFTLNYGLQKFGASVVSIKTTTENGVTTNEVIGVITTSNFELNINQASNMVDNPIETDTDLSTLIANVNALLSNILLKQDKNDNLIQVSLVNGGLTTTDSVVIALNSLNDRVNQNFTNIGNNDNDITQLQQDVITINNKLITGFRYCGSVTTTTPPNSTLLDSFMSLQGLTKQNGDIVNWVQEIEDATDKRYRCEYAVNGWSWQELPKIEIASNGDAGLVMGNYNIGDTTSEILANIIGGKITEIYYKNNGVYYNLSTDLSNAITEIANIINGTTTVGKSQYATYDSTEFGNPTPKTINDKFLSKDLGATKQFVKDYALPKQFGDVYFLNTINGKFETDLNPSSTNIQTTLSSIGYGNILDVYLDNDVNASYQLSKKNSISLSTYIALSTTTSINFKLDVIYKKGGTTTTMCSVITSTYSFTANTYKKIDFTSYLTLISNELNIENGQYEIKISANMTTSTPITFTVYSTTSLPTSFNLNLYSTSLIIGSGYLGEINYHELTGVRSGSYCNYDMPSDTDLLDNTEHRFLLTIPLDAVDSDIVRIRKGTTNIPIFSNKTNTMYHYFLKSYISYSGNASFVATYYNGTFYLNDEIELDKISYVVVDSLSGTITNYRYFMNAYDYDYLGIICRDSNSGENVKYIVSDNGSGTLYNLKSTQIFTDANGDFYYTGTINRSSGVYSLGNKVYLASGNYELQADDITVVGVGPSPETYEVTLSQTFENVMLNGKQPIFVNATLMNVLTNGDITTPVLFNCINTDRFVSGYDHTYVYGSMTCVLSIQMLNVLIVENNGTYYLAMLNFNADIDALKFDIETLDNKLGTLSFTDDGNGNLTQVNYENTTYNVGGGTTLYEHNIVYKGYNWGCINIKIINDDATPFTNNTLTTYLTNKGITNVNNYYIASGIYGYNLGDFYTVVGVYAVTSTTLTVAYYQTSDIATTNISNVYFNRDTVIQLN